MKWLSAFAALTMWAVAVTAGAYDASQNWTFYGPSLSGPALAAPGASYQQQSVVTNSQDAQPVDPSLAPYAADDPSDGACCAPRPHCALQLWKGFCWFKQQCRKHLSVGLASDCCEPAPCCPPPTCCAPLLRLKAMLKHRFTWPRPCDCQTCGPPACGCKGLGSLRHAFSDWLHELDWFDHGCGCGRWAVGSACEDGFGAYPWTQWHGAATPESAPREMPAPPQKDASPEAPQAAPVPPGEKSAFRQFLPPFNLRRLPPTAEL